MDIPAARRTTISATGAPLERFAALTPLPLMGTATGAGVAQVFRPGPEAPLTKQL